MARTRKTTRKDPWSRRFTDEQRRHALTLVASGMTQEQAAKAVGTTANSIWLWRKAAAANGTLPVVRKDHKKATAVAHDNGGAAVERVSNSSKALAKSPYAPADPAHGLSDQEVAAILECKTKHLSMGPAQIRSQLKRFKGWRISIKAIKRVLRQHGYESVYRGSRPQGETIQRFEAPRRNALWQADFAEVRVGPDRLYVLILLDDFSR
ncbi:MAG: hypothetical protein JW940_11125, partial [Polyangiaceae bacterium]|nr:hypothetical protein [Polyangiaceae bacterium]